MSKSIRLALVRPDGSEEVADLNVGDTFVIDQAFDANTDRFSVCGKIKVILRRET